MSGQSKGQVLVLEPNDITRKLIVSILTKAGYTTAEAAKSDDAVELLARKPNLVIMDVEGDGADSFGFLKKMQKDHSKVPLVALAESGDRDSLQQRINLPRVTFLDKPVNPLMVLSTVENSLLADAAQGAVAATGDTDVDLKRKQFMRRAIDLSQQKMDENCGGPFGAVIVKGGQIVGEGWNCVTSTNDPTAHAEMVAIRNAAANTKNFKLEGCEIYTSCEPCPMCLAAIYWARIDKIFYANHREDAERIGFDDAFLYAEIALAENKRSLPAYRMLREEAKIVFDSWEKKFDKTKY
jgi:guanine deaminase